MDLRSSSIVKRDQRVLRALTSQDLRCGSKTPENPSFFEAENDFVRRSSGKNEAEEDGLLLPLMQLLLLSVVVVVVVEMGTRKMALRAEAAVEEGAAEALEGRREEEAED